MTDKEKIRAEIERRIKEYDAIIESQPDSNRSERDAWKWAEDKSLLSFIDSLHEETDAVEGVVSYLVGADQAAIKYKDPSGIFMSYYAKRDGLGVGDKVKIIVIKE